LIGTTRRVNPRTSTIDFTRPPSHPSPNQPPGKENVIFSLHPAREHRRLIFQLGTASPERAVAAARLVAADVAGIDVNAGCPKPFSTSGGMGAALLRAPDTLCRILRALVADVGAPFAVGISVKIRLLDGPTGDADTLALVRALCATGITALTVHCRTPPMRPRERARREQLRAIAAACRAAGVACVMNGDVRDADEARALMREYGADGAMIARAAEANPSCFRARAAGGLAPWREVAAAYVRAALAVDNRWANSKFMLLNLVPGRERAHKALAACKSYGQMCEVLELPELRELAADVDRELGRAGEDVPAPMPAKRDAEALEAEADADAGAEAEEKEGENARKKGRKQPPEQTVAAPAPALAPPPPVALPPLPLDTPPQIPPQIPHRSPPRQPEALLG
jgi:tRNA-dihydrouridine synthase 2